MIKDMRSHLVILKINIIIKNLDLVPGQVQNKRNHELIIILEIIIIRVQITQISNIISIKVGIDMILKNNRKECFMKIK